MWAETEMVIMENGDGQATSNDWESQARGQVKYQAGTVTEYMAHC